jgi:hypothetical protein
MSNKNQIDKDIEEIFLHVKQLKNEESNIDHSDEVIFKEFDGIKDLNDFNNMVTNEKNLDDSIDEDLFEIIGPVEDDEQTRMTVDEIRKKKI